jgi:Lyzozyme M1 (1,4-beta-N-acetylmuramidase)
MQPRVVDVSHHNAVVDLKATAKAGVWGVIHKATQGSHYVDPTYKDRRKMASDAGLLWGAYHFNTGDPVESQVDHFLSQADPDNDTLLVLDFEDYPKSNMSMFQAFEFLQLIEQKVGRRAAIYSGNRIKENIGKINKLDRSYVTSHRLWLCQYSTRTRLPAGWTDWWLWQYTGDGQGPQPHSIPGVSGTGIDLNTYRGTQQELRATWA